MKISFVCVILTLSLLITPLAMPISAANEPLSDVSFFGDSTTHGLIRYVVENDGRHGTPIAKLKREQILTPPSGTFYLRNLPTAEIRYGGEDLPLARALQKASPSVLIVTVGINGLPAWTEETVLSYYRKLLELIRSATPDTKIVLQSVYPTAKERSPKLKAFTVDKIDRLNEWIKSLAAELSLPYLNTASVLKGADGWLVPDYHNGDGMHLNTQGFNRVLEYIIQHPVWKGKKQ